MTPNFTIRRVLDLGDENEKKGLRSSKQSANRPVKFLTVIRVGIRHVLRGRRAVRTHPDTF